MPFVIEELPKQLVRFPQRMSREQFYPVAYYYMYLSRQMESKFKELFRKGYVKGTVILSTGNEATNIGISIPFRPGQDILSLTHRDFGAHLGSGGDPLKLMCQYLANENSPTHGREGNVHHGDIKSRKLPFLSHLGNMMAPTAGATWAARKNGEDVFGLTTIGDGGTSTGDFHEALNFASVHKIPVLFIINNNHYAYSTPTRLQYNCEKLSIRASAYGIEGKTIDGTDVWEVYENVYNALEKMQQDQMPRILECMTLRLDGHAVYDKAEYVTEEERNCWLKREPLARARKVLAELGYSEKDLSTLEKNIDTYIDEITREALKYGRPKPEVHLTGIFANNTFKQVKPFSASSVRNLNAVNLALDYILSGNKDACILGQDVGTYGSAFKTCKGLSDKFPGRVIDTPICESATAGFCLGASQMGARPIMEFQFADFGTEAVTQVGLNAGTWYFRSDTPAPVVYRLPCGAGVNLGAFHSGEFDGLWSRFPGLKLFYPVTPQETFEALIAAFYDPNPCIVFEHKLLYWGKQGDIQFDGNLESLYRPRKYTEGSGLTVVAFGAMTELVQSIILNNNYSVELWNPFILNPLDLNPIMDSVAKTGKLLVIQESGETAGIGDKVISKISSQVFDKLKAAPVLISAPDLPVPFAKELETFYLPGQDRIRQTIASMIGEVL